MKVGLILGGGGVRGAAHIGALRELHRLGVNPHAVAGTSSGGVVAALYAAGADWDEIEKIARNMTWRSAIGWRLPFQRARPSLLDVVREHLHGRTFEDLPTKLALSAFEPDRGEVVFFRSGPLLPALRATIALPGVFPPARAEGGQILVDGGLISSLPMSALPDVDVVIAIDVRPDFRTANRPHPLYRRRWIYERAYVTLIRQSSDADLAKADLVVAPEIRDVGTLDFKHIGRCIEAGAEAVRKMHAEITPLIQSAQLP